jgi:hypothetical protein
MCEMTLADVRNWLIEHRLTHTEWADWFENSPNDPRANNGMGDATFHRNVEKRYSSMIATIEASLKVENLISR